MCQEAYGINHKKRVWPQYVPLNNVDKFVKVGSLTVVRWRCNEEGVHVSDAGERSFFEIGEVWYSHFAQWGNLHTIYLYSFAIAKTVLIEVM